MTNDCCYPLHGAGVVADCAQRGRLPSKRWRLERGLMSVLVSKSPLHIKDVLCEMSQGLSEAHAAVRWGPKARAGERRWSCWPRACWTRRWRSRSAGAPSSTPTSRRYARRRPACPRSAVLERSSGCIRPGFTRKPVVHAENWSAHALLRHQLVCGARQEG